MRKGGGKTKGAALERQIAKTLSLWLSDGEREDLLWRSSMSGGRATVASKKGKKLSAQVGDLSGIDELGHQFISRYIVECKHYKSLNVEALFFGAQGRARGYCEFWRKLVKEAEDHRKHPLLVAKQNQKPITIGTTIAGLYSFKGANKSFEDYDLHLLLEALGWSYFPTLNLVVLEFDTFLEELEFNVHK